MIMVAVVQEIRQEAVEVEAMVAQVMKSLIQMNGTYSEN